MTCAWSDDQIYRYADGALDAATRDALAEHLSGCAPCRERLDAARRLDATLRAEIAPLPAPPTLAGRVANAVAAEREGRRPLSRLLTWFGLASPLPRWGRGAGGVRSGPTGDGPGRERPDRARPSGRRRIIPLPFRTGTARGITRGIALRPAALTLALVLVVGAFAFAPNAAVAVVQRALTFIPGLGIRDVDEGHLVASHPVSAEALGATFTVEALLSDGQRTTVEFKLTGLPGGKVGWESRQEPTSRTPVLRDANGQEYRLAGGYHGTGGGEHENHMSGRLMFDPLPSDLTSVDLIVPADYFVPPAVLPGADANAWTLHIPLAPPSAAGLAVASPQTATATASDVTLRVVASTFGPEQTVLQVEGEAAGSAEVVTLWPNGGDPADNFSLQDDQGRSYRLLPESVGSAHAGNDPVRRDLYFEPLAPDARSVTLVVEALLVAESGEASVTIPLAGRQVDESFTLDQTARLGRNDLRLTSARLGSDHGDGTTWLYVDVDLGEPADGRMFSTFSLEGTPGGGWMMSMGRRDGTQVDRFGVPVGRDQREVTLRLTRPTLNIAGPWELTFPVRGGSK